MALVFLLLHAVFVAVTALLGLYILAAIFALLGAYFFVAFHPSFFHLPQTLLATQSDILRTETKNLIPQLVGFLRRYSLSVTFVFFYAGVFGITHSLGLFSYDVAACVVSLLLFWLSWHLRLRSAPIVEEFFRTNTILFSLVYSFVFVFRFISEQWQVNAFFVVNVLLSIVGYVFVIFLQKWLSEAWRRAFFAWLLLYSLLSGIFLGMSLLAFLGIFPALEAAGLPNGLLVLAAVFFASLLYGFVLPRIAKLTIFSGVCHSLSESLLLLSFVGFSAYFLLFPSSSFPDLFLLLACVATFYRLRIRTNPLMLGFLYVGVSELFLSLSLPQVGDVSGFVNLGLGAVFTEFIFPLFTIFLLPFSALALPYTSPLSRYYSFSLIFFSLAYGIPTFCYIVARYHERFLNGLFFSVAGFCFFALFMIISIRISADRRLDRKG